MNWIEKFVYNKLKHNAYLKIAVRNIYQAIFDILPINHNEFYPKGCRFEADSFFGFHDVPNINETKKLALACKLQTNELIVPNIKSNVLVGYYHLEHSFFCVCAESSTWNFHKGVRLQWVNESEFIFNSHFILGSHYSTLYNIETGIKKEFSSIDTVSFSKNIATSFSYGRLEHFMPGYGYYGLDDNAHIEKRIPDSTALELINLTNNKRLFSFSFEELTSHCSKSLQDFGSIFVTHTLFSACGKFCSFMVRSSSSETNMNRKSNLLILNLENSNICRLPTEDMVSHYVWNNNSIMAYARVNGKDGHYMFSETNWQTVTDYSEFMQNNDGHHTFIGKDKVLIDSYPDRFRVQSLSSYNLISGQVEILARTRHPKKFQSNALNGHVCCDLHPRSSIEKKYVSFDLIYKGKRSLAWFKV
jgi:hypothetical protein